MIWKKNKIQSLGGPFFEILICALELKEEELGLKGIYIQNEVKIK